MSTTIRAASGGDGELLADLNRFVHEIHVSRRPDHFKPVRPADVALWFGGLLQDPAARIWIAEEDGKPVGYVLAIHHERPETPFSHARRWCEVDQISVSPENRRRGVARALVQEVIADARAGGVFEIELNSWSFNAGAHQAFRRLGFVSRAIRFELEQASPVLHR